LSFITAIAPSATPNYWDVTISNAATLTAASVPATFSTVANKVTLWQHEIGTDEVNGPTSNAIESYFETCDLGWVRGGPAQSAPMGDNVWLHLERVEPDFIQSGEMSLEVVGRPYAQAEDSTTGPYTFDPDTNKIDLREQRRELRLKFTSNVQGGTFQLGKLLVSVDAGDVRGY
jgi:hypothetical protein